ncbi:MAG: trehalose-phosphatase [Thermoplasmata archaeon]
MKRHPEETGIFLDLDGTLAELVDVPEAVRLPAQTRVLLGELETRYRSVVIISGRAASAIRDIVRLPGLTYVGNHGLEVIESGEHRVWLSSSDATRMRGMEDLLRQSIQLEGVLLELKELSHAIHYRRAPEPRRARRRILAALERLALEGIQIREGKFLVQIRPDASLDKGTAVDRLVRERATTRVLYAGDDTTDIDAFRVIGRLADDGLIEGYRVAVEYPEGPEELLSASDLRVQGVQEVQALLGWLAG